MENGPHRQLRHQFIVLDTPFTTPPHLDKLIVGECSKSTKSNDNLFSDIQVHFLGLLTGILESINSGTELEIEEVESAVKAALTFLGNASSRCTSIRRQGVLQDYKKDLMSFAAESDELFCSATQTLLGPAFPKKASAHLRQMQTPRFPVVLRNESNRVFRGPPCNTLGEGASLTIFRDATNLIPGVGKVKE